METAPGMFEPRDVQVGERVDDKSRYFPDSKSGDKVAVSGGYLIDSESQLKTGTGDQDPDGPKGRGPVKADMRDIPPTSAAGKEGFVEDG